MEELPLQDVVVEGNGVVITVQLLPAKEVVRSER